MSKVSHRACMVGTTILFVCCVLYVPLLFSLRPPTLIEWMSMKKDLRIYVSPDNETAILLAEDTCLTSNGTPADLTLVVVVCSSTLNVDARDAIRSTWGSVGRNNSDSRLVFLLGRPENESLQDGIMKESQIHGDIVQEDFVDTYNNLTLKSVMMLKWVSSRCSNAKFLLKTDDDTFVNLASLRSLLKLHGRQSLLVGSLICGAVPIKDRKSKWYSPNSMFNEGVYPNYLSGTAYVISNDLIRPLYKTALETPLFHLEDIFITGICSRKINVRPRDYSGFTYQKRQLDPCVFRRIISSHRMTPSNLRNIWKQMHQSDLQCNVTTTKRKTRSYHPRNCR